MAYTRPEIPSEAQGGWWRSREEFENEGDYRNSGNEGVSSDLPYQANYYTRTSQVIPTTYEQSTQTSCARGSSPTSYGYNCPELTYEQGSPFVEYRPSCFESGRDENIQSSQSFPLTHPFGYNRSNVHSPMYDNDRGAWSNPIGPRVLGPCGSGGRGQEKSQEDYLQKAYVYDYQGTYKNTTTFSIGPSDGNEEGSDRGGGDPSGPWACCLCHEVNGRSEGPKMNARIMCPGCTSYRCHDCQSKKSQSSSYLNVGNFRGGKQQSSLGSRDSSLPSRPVVHCIRCSHRRCKQCQPADEEEHQSPSELPKAETTTARRSW
ncbi:hypothetical protein DL98DRAFT_576118, partial [Cadophora sp. DSE1049]